MNEYFIDFKYLNINNSFKLYYINLVKLNNEESEYEENKFFVDNFLFCFFEKIFSKEFIKLNLYTKNFNNENILFLCEIFCNTNYKIEYKNYKKNIYSIKITKNKKTINIKCIDLLVGEKCLNNNILNIKNLNAINCNSITNIKFLKKNNFFSNHYYIIYKRLKNKNKNYFFLSSLYDSRIYIRNFVYLNSIILKQSEIQIINNKPIYSLSGISLNYWLQHFNKKIPINIEENEDLFIRKSYFGGRNEVFGNPNKLDDIYEIDFIGMYCQSMKELFPTEKGHFIYSGFDLKQPGFYEIEYESELNIPILPHTNVNSSKLLFVNGSNLSGVFWYEEINFFLKEGGKITNIKTAYIYEKTDYIFKNFCLKLENLKNCNTGGIKLIYKKIINSLYGRFAVKNHNSKLMIINDYKYFEELEKKKLIISFININNFYVVELDQSFFKNSNNNCLKNKRLNFLNIAYSSIITSRGRIKMLEAIKEIKKEGKVFFCDTDSIIFSVKKDFNLNLLSFFDQVKWNEVKIKDAVFINQKTFSIKYNNFELSVINNIKTKEFFFKYLKFTFYSDLTEFKKYYFKNKKIKKKLFRINTVHSRKFNTSKKKTFPFNFINGMYI